MSGNCMHVFVLQLPTDEPSVHPTRKFMHQEVSASSVRAVPDAATDHRTAGGMACAAMT